MKDYVIAFADRASVKLCQVRAADWRQAAVLSGITMWSEVEEPQREDYDSDEEFETALAASDCIPLSVVDAQREARNSGRVFSFIRIYPLQGG